MSLLQQINETAHQTTEEQAVIMENFDRLQESIDPSAQPLMEAATEWLAKLRTMLGRGAIDPKQSEGVILILGALMGLSNPVYADAADDKGDLGTILYNLSNNEDKQNSILALKRLKEVGRHPSFRKFAAQAKTALENPKESNDTISKVQTKIDQVMRTKIAREKGGSTSATGGAGVGGNPERKA